MDNFASSTGSSLPSVYELAGNGVQVFSRRQIIAEVAAGRLSPETKIREQGTADWFTVSALLLESPRPISASSNVQTTEPTLLKRAIGYLIDSAIIGIPIAILAVGGTLITVWLPAHDDIALLLYIGFVSLGGLAGVLYLILTPITPVRATLGMYCLGLELRDVANKPIGLKASIVRFLAATCISGIFGVGYLWAAMDPNKRTLHDILAGTRVISTRIK